MLSELKKAIDREELPPAPVTAAHPRPIVMPHMDLHYVCTRPPFYYAWTIWRGQMCAVNGGWAFASEAEILKYAHQYQYYKVYRHSHMSCVLKGVP